VTARTLPQTAGARVARRPTDPPVPVLMYHAIGTSASPAFARYVLAPHVFRAHLDHLVDHGFTALTAAAVARARRCGAALPDRAVVLTFDDAYRDFLTTVLPELEARALAATLFVPTAFVGSTARWLRDCGEQDRPLLGWSELREVAAAGVEVAAHSHTHPQLDRVPATVARAEAATSRVALEDALGAAVEGFAYPYGYWNRPARHAVRAAGFGYACQVGELTSSAADDPWAVPRHSIAAGTGVSGLARLLDAPATGRAAHARSALGRVGWRTARRVPGVGGRPREGAP